jgi:uncharacterized protein YjbJ (UPF0337 family)
MADPTEIKGRAKEAAGDLTDDNEMKNEGKVDRATGATKENLEDASDKTKDKLEDAGDKVKDMLHKD